MVKTSRWQLQLWQNSMLWRGFQTWVTTTYGCWGSLQIPCFIMQGARYQSNDASVGSRRSGMRFSDARHTEIEVQKILDISYSHWHMLLYLFIYYCIIVYLHRDAAKTWCYVWSLKLQFIGCRLGFHWKFLKLSFLQEI